jgi:tetratricopeptide (TPR) repeat protein
MPQLHLLWIAAILLIGLGMAIDMPFVFGENFSNLSGYTSDQLEKASAKYSDLAGIPPVSSPNDFDTIEVVIVTNEINKSSSENNSKESQDSLEGFAQINQSYKNNATINLSLEKFSTELPPTYIIVGLPVTYPNYQAYWFDEGNKNYNNGNYQRAIECYDQAINLNPKLKEAWCNKGIALCRLEKYKDALKAFDQALNICPEYSKAWRCKGQAFEAIGQDDEAEQAFRNAG